MPAEDLTTTGYHYEYYFPAITWHHNQHQSKEN